MTTLLAQCKVTFTSNLPRLRHLRGEYHVLSQEEFAENSDDMYYTGILKTLENLITEIQGVKEEF